MYSVTEHFVAWLAERGHAASTYPAAGAQPPFVTVERTGGWVTDLVDHPTMAVQTWAETEAEAEQLALELREALLTGPLPRGVHRCEAQAGPYPFWDEATRFPRYQTVYQLTSQLTE